MKESHIITMVIFSKIVMMLSQVEKLYDVFYEVEMEWKRICVFLMAPGPRLNIKTVLSTYGDFHVKDKTAVRTSYL